jgi:hypothetical protein
MICLFDGRGKERCKAKNSVTKNDKTDNGRILPLYYYLRFLFYLSLNLWKHDKDRCILRFK